MSRSSADAVSQLVTPHPRRSPPSKRYAFPKYQDFSSQEERADDETFSQFSQSIAESSTDSHYGAKSYLKSVSRFLPRHNNLGDNEDYPDDSHANSLDTGQRDIFKLGWNFAQEALISDHFVRSKDIVRQIRIGGPPRKNVFRSTNRIDMHTWRDIASRIFQTHFGKVTTMYFFTISLIEFFMFDSLERFTTFSTLMSLLTIQCAHDFYLHYQSKKTVNQMNCMSCSVLRQRKWVSIPSGEIIVGEIIRIKPGCTVPADLVLLAVGGNSKECSVDTSNINGASFISRKVQVMSGSLSLVSESADQLSDLCGHCTIRCRHNTDRPIDGVIFLSEYNQTVPIQQNNLLFRGCTIIGNEWVYGLAIFVGRRTSIWKDWVIPSEKGLVFNHLTKRILHVVGVSLLVISLIVAAIGRSMEIREFGGYNAWYIPTNLDQRVDQLITSWCLLLIQFSTAIPLSLYITLTFAQISMTWIIQRDKDLHDVMKGASHIKCSAHHAELGMVDLMITNKTGTITDGKKILRFCAVKDTIYMSTERTWNNVQGLSSLGFEYQSYAELQKRVISDAHDSDLHYMLLGMLTCNLSFSGGDITHERSDDNYITSVANSLGYKILKLINNLVVIEGRGRVRTYKFIQHAQPERTLQIATAVIQEKSGQVLVLAKGPVAAFASKANHHPQNVDIIVHAERLSSFCSRVFIVVKRLLTDKECHELLFQDEKLSISEDRALETQTTSLVDSNLVFVSALAIEDTMYDRACSTIIALRQANIKVWVATGDLLEPSLSICRKAGVLDEDSHLIQIASLNRKQTQMMLMRLCSRNLDQTLGQRHQVALVIDGDCFSYILADKGLTLLFAGLLQECDAVVATEFTPMLKAALVITVNSGNFRRKLIMAVGNGANDMNMLSAADIGVSVGSQFEASLVSDIEIGQFEHLEKLVLIYGHRAFHNFSTLIFYCFYKNLSLVTMAFLYEFYNQFSASSIFPLWQTKFFNSLLSGFPILWLAVMEKNIPDSVLLAKAGEFHPQGQLASKFSAVNIAKMLVLAIMDGTIIFFFVSKAHQAQYSDVESLGLIMHLCLIIIVNCKVLLIANHINWQLVAAIHASFLSWFLFACFYDFPMLVILCDPSIWLTIMAASAACTILPLCGNEIISFLHKSFKFFHSAADHCLSTFQRRILISSVSDSDQLYGKNCFPKTQADLTRLPPKTVGQRRSMLLTFSESDAIEKYFRESMLYELAPMTIRGIISILIFTSLYNIYAFIIGGQIWSLINLAAGLAIMLVIIYVWKCKTKRAAVLILRWMPYIAIVASVSKNLSITVNGRFGTALFAFAVFLLLRLRLPIALVLCMWDFLIYNAVVFATAKDFTVESIFLFDIGYIIFFSVPFTFGYMLEKWLRDDFANFVTLKRELDWNETLLSKMFPSIVLKEWGLQKLENNDIMARMEPCVTIMFVSLVGFDDIVENSSSAASLVENLDSFYSTVDDLCAAENVYKVETVGNVFMACSISSAVAITELSLRVMALSRGPYFHDLFPGGIKIGIHTGEVMTGIISNSRPTLSLFGDTVNTASRMCSSAVVGDIAVSQETYDLTWQFYIWDHREAFIKGKGQMAIHSIKDRLESNSGLLLLHQITDSTLPKPNDQGSHVSSASSFQRLDEVMADIMNVEIDSLSRPEFDSLKMLLPTANIPIGLMPRFLEEQGEIGLKNFHFVLVFMFIFPVLQYTFTSDIKTGPMSRLFFMHIFSSAFCLACGAGLRIFNIRLSRLVFSSCFVIAVFGELAFQILMYHNYLFNGQAIRMCLLFVIASNSGVLLFYQIAVLVVILLLAFVLLFMLSVDPGINLIVSLLTVGGCTAINILAAFSLETSMCRTFINNYQLERERIKSYNLLTRLLPSHVVSLLQREEPCLFREWQSVTILYSDIVEFTKFSSKVSPIEVISLLSVLFGQFDDIVANCGLCKVQTIGDAYVIVGGLTEPLDGASSSETDKKSIIKNAKQTVIAGGMMLQEILRIPSSTGNILQLRIGIHTGKIIAGVIGSHRLRFDIWGRDALIANKIEQEGKARRIVVSGPTYETLSNEDGFKFEDYKVLKIRDREISTHLVTDIPNQESRITAGVLKPAEKMRLWPDCQTKLTK
uniref:Guanylate cyclase domain-containing protein n=1 Tax=Spongospora subterranea TaxID=70186 RepID=A0A0H5QHG0_9EUKA|eukprot:CRZ00776.1 hypothetical protein [Spongospora subterranea]